MYETMFHFLTITKEFKMSPSDPNQLLQRETHTASACPSTLSPSAFLKRKPLFVCSKRK